MQTSSHMKCVKSTLHRGGEGQNVQRAKFSNTMAKVVARLNLSYISYKSIACVTNLIKLFHISFSEIMGFSPWPIQTDSNESVHNVHGR